MADAGVSEASRAGLHSTELKADPEREHQVSQGAPPTQPDYPKEAVTQQSPSLGPNPPPESPAHILDHAQDLKTWFEQFAGALGAVERLGRLAQSLALVDGLKSALVEQTAGYRPVLECQQALEQLAPSLPTARALNEELLRLTTSYGQTLDLLVQQLQPSRELRDRLLMLARAIEPANDLLDEVMRVRATVPNAEAGAQVSEGASSEDELVQAVTTGFFNPLQSR